MSLKIVKNDHGKNSEKVVWDLLMKIMKSLTYLGITKFFFFLKKKI